MEKIKKWVEEYPIITAIILATIAIALTFVPLDSILFVIKDEQLVSYLNAVIEQVGISLLLIWGIKRRGKLAAYGYQLKVEKVGCCWLLGLYILSDIIAFMMSGKAIDWNRKLVVLMLILTYLSTGLFEETLFRGIMLRTMLSKWGSTKAGYYRAIFLSSFLFGSVHFIHFILGHASLAATLAQVGYASMLGVYFCGCVLRQKNIYPAMVLHGLVDIVGSLKEVTIGGGINKGYINMTVVEASVCVIIVLPLFINGMLLLRKAFKTESSRRLEGEHAYNTYCG